MVFFQHGILDTSLTWVSNGTEGSQAFAAYDAGFDVWLGNARSNPPRAHKGAAYGGGVILMHSMGSLTLTTYNNHLSTADPKMMGMHYWNFSINELGIQDMDAQVGGAFF